MSTAARGAGRGSTREEVARVDAVPKATGSFAYSSDLYAAGMLHGATVRSPHAHAHIVAIDPSDALAAPGVQAVLTHRDVPGEKRYGLHVADQPVLAIDRVRYFGEPVALVAAAHPEEARRAAAAVKVDYRPLEPIVDARRAPEQAPIHDESPGEGHRGRRDPCSNVVRSVVIRHGDPDAQASVSVAGVYEVGMQDQAFLGPESGLAIPDGHGGVDLYVATQSLHGDRDQVAPCLGLPPEMVRLHLAGVGGAFGGREELSMQIHAALLALRTDRPVKMVYGREESFVGHAHRHPATIWAEHRATRDGDLVCVRARILLDGGAYASTSGAVILNACTHACGPYRVPNALIEGSARYTNNPPCGAMRGFGAVQACIAHESQMDKLAAALDMDPVELRLRNALEPGNTLPTGARVEGSLPVAEVIRRCAALPAPDPERPSGGSISSPGGAGNTAAADTVGRGVGFAVALKNIGYGAGADDYTAARIRLAADPVGDLVAEVHCAAAEVGQGVTNVIERVVRAELGVDQVVLAPRSTATVGSAGSTSASRTTWMVTGALTLACAAAREKLDGHGGRLGAGEEIDVERIYRHPPTSPIDPHDGQATGDRVYHGFACVAMRVVVEVDVELGISRVAWAGTAQDVGRALNPLAVEGQIEGGTAQGIGLALMEELRTDGGVVANRGFADYLIPTSLDVPPAFDIELVEDPEPSSPYGVKGVGEPPTVVSSAAVLSALRDATGQELARVPVRPEHIARTGDEERSP